MTIIRGSIGGLEVGGSPIEKSTLKRDREEDLGVDGGRQRVPVVR